MRQMVAKRILSSLFLVMVLGLLACAEEGIFPDRHLEAAIGEAIGKPEGAILASEL